MFLNLSYLVESEVSEVLYQLIVGLASAKRASERQGIDELYRQLPAKYLPKTKQKGGLLKERKIDSEWLRRFNEDQQRYCGSPAMPIEFSKRQHSFEPVPDSSWPWMVRYLQ